MNITFDTIPDQQYPHKILRVKLNTGVPQSIMASELEKEDWKPYGMETKIDHNLWKGYRYKVHQPKSAVLQEISRFIHADETRKQVIEALYAQKSEFHSMWGMFPDIMLKNTDMHAEFTKDLPGFENGIHCDYRLLVATGVVYFTVEDNPDLSSEFYDNPYKDNPYRITTEYSTGWVHANDWNTWHDGWNRTNQVRYSMLLGLTLRLVDF